MRLPATSWDLARMGHRAIMGDRRRRGGVVGGGGAHLPRHRGGDRLLGGGRQQRGDAAGEAAVGGLHGVRAGVAASTAAARGSCSRVVASSYSPSLRLLSLSNEFIIQRY